MNTQLDTFQTALLTQLRREVIESPRQAPHSAPASARARTRRSTVRRLSLAAVASGAAASLAVTLGLVSFGGTTLGGATPAFAITTAQDGDVVVTLTGSGPSDAQQLQAALKDHGIDADVIYDPDRFPDVAPNAERGVETRYFGPVSEGPAITVRPTEQGSVVLIDGDKCDGVHWTMYLDDQGVTGILTPRPTFAPERYHPGARTKVLAKRPN